MNKEIAGVLAGLGISVGGIAALGIWNQSLPLPWWVFVLIVLVLGYAAFTAGMAMERTSGPWVEVGPLELDDLLVNVFYVVVKNGPVPAKVSVRIVRVIDSFGRRRTERAWEGHWRGRPTSYDGDLAEHEEAQYGLLRAIRGHDGNSTLMINTRETGRGRLATEMPTFHPIAGDPRFENGTITLGVVVTCETKAGVKGRPRELEFHVAPDPDSRAGFRVSDRALAPILRPTTIEPAPPETSELSAPDQPPGQTPG